MPFSVLKVRHCDHRSGKTRLVSADLGASVTVSFNSASVPCTAVSTPCYQGGKRHLCCVLSTEWYMSL